MERLNGDEKVSVIKASGNIPFVTSEDVSLVLIDTPGPNNSRNPEHKRVQSEFLNKSSKSLVLYIMESTFGSDDDNALLGRVADSMKVGGTHKHITYTCPNGKPCRDNKLHEEKYLKENMEDEFRIREKIIRDIESTSEDEYGKSGADSDLYRGAGEVLDSVDPDAEKPIRYAEYALGADENVGNMERPLGYAGGTAGADDRSHGANGTDADGVSGDASSASGTDSDDDLDLDGDLPITGWESERELLTATLLGGTDSEAEFEETDFDFAYPDDPADHLGIDSAYLAADLINIVDSDNRVEDCTTMKQPPRNKKNTQSGGFNMSM